MTGDRANLKPNRKYEVEVTLSGSLVTLNVDGVDVPSTTLPYNTGESQVGIFCMSTADVHIKDFKVHGEEPTAFVVMQFTPQFDELYEEVVKPVCRDMSILPIRADESYTSEIIIADVVKRITRSKIVIAEISPANPNVYYEVGYAHAVGKPTILIAERSTKLPFDVSAFRTLFYDNSIGGKKKIEDGLRNHLNSILKERVTPNKWIEPTSTQGERDLS